MERGNKKIVFKGEAGFAVSQCASSALKEEEEEGSIHAEARHGKYSRLLALNQWSTWDLSGCCRKVNTILSAGDRFQ